MDKVVLQSSQNLGSSGVSRPYHRKKASCHSFTPSSVLFTVNGCTVRHAPVFFTCHKLCANWAGSLFRVPINAFSGCLAFCFHTSSLPSLRNLAWYAVLNSSWPLSGATRFPVMTHDDVQFSGAVIFRSVRARPACFTGRRVSPRPGIPSPES